MAVRRTVEPIEERIPADRQGAKRHYGVHPYFTRRPFNVVRRYVLHYSQPGDRVLDPFGGSGVTAIEAFLENRTGIQNDINPLANFIAKGIADLTRGTLTDYQSALAHVRERCERRLGQIDEMTESDVKRLLGRLALPPNVELPSTSDVSHYHDLFTPKQLASLAVLRQAVEAVDKRYARHALQLAWSAALTKLNRTFLSAEGRAESRGGSSIFSIYRYKIAAKPVLLPAWPTFQERAMNVLDAKQEVDTIVTYHKEGGAWRGNFELHAKDVEELVDEIKPVDYIFTDPPYGGHISYLDLSTLWNVWLGEQPSERARGHELIVGGELQLTEGHYVNRLSDCIEACFHLLRSGGWLSVVFQHWNTAYFRAILTAAASSGGDLRAAVSQVGDPIWSMHKKKNQESVLAGEMILTFQKTGKPRSINTTQAFDVGRAVTTILREHRHPEIHGEYLFNRLIVEAWKASAIDSLNVSRTGFADMLTDAGWQYDETSHQWVKKGRESTPLSALWG